MVQGQNGDSQWRKARGLESGEVASRGLGDSGTGNLYQACFLSAPHVFVQLTLARPCEVGTIVSEIRESRHRETELSGPRPHS